VLFVPKWTLSLLADYSFPINDKMYGFIRPDAELTGNSKGSFQTTDTNYYNPAYSIVNLNVGVNVTGLELAVFARNLGDNHTILQQPQINSVVEGYTLRPRTVGITASKRF
jgi:iron complex outermembrane receptor protein